MWASILTVRVPKRRHCDLELIELDLYTLLQRLKLLNYSYHDRWRYFSIPWEQVTIRPVLGAMSTPVTSLSWPFSSSFKLNLFPLRL